MPIVSFPGKNQSVLVEEKTGISKMNMGVNADMLQNTSATAAALTAQAGAGQCEVMARNLAEGTKKLFQQCD